MKSGSAGRPVCIECAGDRRPDRPRDVSRGVRERRRCDALRRDRRAPRRTPAVAGTSICEMRHPAEPERDRSRRDAATAGIEHQQDVGGQVGEDHRVQHPEPRGDARREDRRRTPAGARTRRTPRPSARPRRRTFARTRRRRRTARRTRRRRSRARTTRRDARRFDAIAGAALSSECWPQRCLPRLHRRASGRSSAATIARTG